MFYVHPTLHPLVTQQTPGRFSHLSQCSEHSPFHDYLQSPCNDANHTQQRPIRTQRKQREDCSLFFLQVESSLGSADVDRSFQLLLAVVIIVHQLTVPQYKPTHLPVPEIEGHTIKTKAKMIQPGHLTSFFLKSRIFISLS